MSALLCTGQRRRGNAFVFSDPRDPIHGLMRRVTMRRGSLLLWNQTTAHGAVPNASNRSRVAQFIRGFRAGEMTPARAASRARAIERECRKAGSLGDLTPLAPHVFGFGFGRAVNDAEHADASAAPVAPVPVADRQRWSGAWPYQLRATDAAGFAFNSLLDLIPGDDGRFLVPVHPDTDARSAMRYRQLHTLAVSVAGCRALAGLPPGSRIACSLPANCPELAACFISVAAGAGMTFAPLNPDLTEDLVTFQLEDLPAAALIVLAGKRGRYSVARGAADCLGIRVVELEPDTQTCGLFTLTRAGADTDAGVGSAPAPTPAAPAPDVTRDTAALVLHTSGTTRRPKLVPLTHGQLGVGSICVASTLQLDRQSLGINVMPLFHLHGLMINVLVTAIAGAQVICAPVFEAPLFFQWLRPVPAAASNTAAGADSTTTPPPMLSLGRPGPSWYSAVPTIHQEVLRQAELLADENGGVPPPHSLRVIRNCSAALPASVGARLEAVLPGVAVVTSYAMTEALPICSNPVRGPRNLSSVGPPAGPDVRIVAADGDSATPLPQGEVGEVVVHGACVFRGYEQRDYLDFDPNCDAFIGSGSGWLRTGDKGWFDAAGHLHLAGRFKEVINRAGEKISPLAVEHALLDQAPTHLAGLRSLMVFAAPHDELGEAVGVAVCCDSGRTFSLTQLRACGNKSGKLGRQWLPELLVHVADIPKGPTGKPARIGFATKVGLPTLSFARSMPTIDLRGSAGRPKDYESGRRSGARKAAAARSAARKQARGTGTGRRGGYAGSTSTLAGCIQLVAAAMSESVGEDVDESDDLFDAGLSSISATRLRAELDGRTGLTLPRRIIYDHTTVRALAAAIFFLKTPEGPGADDPDAEGLSMLTARATSSFRDGRLEDAIELCLKATTVAGLPVDWASTDSTKRIAALIATVESIELLAPVLLVIVPALLRLDRQQQAAVACRLLVGARIKEKAKLIDVALAWAQLARLSQKLGQGQSAREAVNASIAAATDSSGRSTAPDPHTAAAAAVGQCTSGGPGCARTALASAVPCGFCTTLTTLVLRGQQLAVVPGCIGHMLRLTVLDLSENALSVLPASLEALSELRELHLMRNQLQDLPGLDALQNLDSLNIQNNRFAALPACVPQCRRLRTLRWGWQRADSVGLVSPTTCSTVTDTAFASRELRVLELNGNDAASFPGMHPDNVALTTVLASFNRLAEIPAPLAACSKSIQVLNLGTNLFGGSIGGSGLRLLSYFTGLTRLRLEVNGLIELPGCIGELRRLRELWIFGNALAALPEELGDCAALETLDAHHNLLTTLPTSMARLTKLKSLYLGNNRLIGLAALRDTVLRHLPLHNLGLGLNAFDMAEAFVQPGTRVGLGWNRDPGSTPAALRGKLTEDFAATDHLFDPACPGTRGEVLLVAFAGQGIGNLQWNAPCSAARAAGIAIDALYLADPSNSYYLQDPTGGWAGQAHFAGLVAKHSAHYPRVMVVGSSMGGTAALLHAGLGDRVLSFGPRVDLDRTHGSYVPEPARRDCASAVRASIARARARGAHVGIHVGSDNLEDVLQAERVAGGEAGVGAVEVVKHSTFHHNVPMFLEREGLLVPLFKRELVALLIQTHAHTETTSPTKASSAPGVSATGEFIAEPVADNETADQTRSRKNRDRVARQKARVIKRQLATSANAKVYAAAEDEESKKKAVEDAAKAEAAREKKASEDERKRQLGEDQRKQADDLARKKAAWESQKTAREARENQTAAERDAAVAKEQARRGLRP